MRRRRALFLIYAAPAILLVGVHAAIANHYPRYNLGLIGPFAVGAAWVIARAVTEALRFDGLPSD